MTSVLILNQYYPPDTAATGLHAAGIAEACANAGHHVEAIVGQPSYGSDSIDAASREHRNGVDITRIAIGGRRGRARMLSRISAYLHYTAGAALHGSRRHAGVVVAFHVPPTLPGVAAALAARLRAGFIYVPQDIHPDILLASDLVRMPRFMAATWDAYNRYVLHRADWVVALGHGMRMTLLEKGARAENICVIPPWAEPELDVRPIDYEFRRELGISADFVVVHSGNEGLVHPLDPVLHAARKLATDRVAFVFAGAGVRRPDWIALAQRLQLINAHFIDYQRGERYARLVASADVGLVSLASGAERLAVPSRAFAFLAAGRPLVAHMAAAADVAELVQAEGAGWQVWGSDTTVALIRRLLREPETVRIAGMHARRAFEANLTRRALTARYVELISSMESSEAPPRRHGPPPDRR